MDKQPTTSARTVKRRTRIVVDDSALAGRIGQRLREARLRAGLTQQQLADGRFTKAYVSALENGLSKPSMAALNFFADRLGMSASRFLEDEPATWRRVEVDLALAAGDYGKAIDGFTELLEAEEAPAVRAHLLAGLAEALCKTERGPEAVRAAGESARLFEQLDRRTEAAQARYWMASGHIQSNNTPEAEAILQDLLAQVRGGLHVEPDFQVRLLIGLANAATYDGRHQAALVYLEEVRSAAAGLDDQRRATYLFGLAYAYRETGDYEAAVRTGIASLALSRAAGFEVLVAGLENDLALSYLAIGNLEKAQELAGLSREHFENMGARRWLAHVEETRSQVALAQGDVEAAGRYAEAALALADETGNGKAAVSSLRTLAKVRRTAGDLPGALALAERAADRARALNSPGLIRDALADWAELLAAAGDHERAFAVLRGAVRP